MFRRILNWLAKNFGPTATPEEAAGYATWKDYAENYTPISKESLAVAMRKAAAKTAFNGGEGNLGIPEIEMQIDADDPSAVPQAYLVRDLVELTPADVEATDRSRLCKGGPLDGHWFANQDGSITDLFTLVKTDSDAPDKQCVVGYHDSMQRREGDVFGTYVARCDGFDTFWIWTGWDEPGEVTSQRTAS